MSLRFLHTADWQLGKPYGAVENPARRHHLQQARLDSVTRLGELARTQRAAFVLVAGDLFDSVTPEKALVSSACAAIGKMGLPVFVIPGNHDHGGPGGVWTQPFFLEEQRALAPNLRVLLTNDRVDLPGGGHLFPCPLLTRHDSTDTTSHLRAAELPDDHLPRLVLAHGSVADFGSDEADRAPNRIAWERLVKPAPGDSAPRFDYLALGDWHGVKSIDPRAWYSGTPEPDRFPKNADYRSGQALLVEIDARGAAPVVTPHPVAGITWRHEELRLTADLAPSLAFAGLQPDAAAVNKIALRLVLDGEIGFAAKAELETEIQKLEARVARLELESLVRIRPTDAEIQQLADRPADPLLSRVAAELHRRAAAGDAVALHALGELHAAVHTPAAR